MKSPLVSSLTKLDRGAGVGGMENNQKREAGRRADYFLFLLIVFTLKGRAKW